MCYNGGGEAGDADEGRKLGFSIFLWPPSIMKPPFQMIQLPIPDVPPLPTIFARSGVIIS